MFLGGPFAAPVFMMVMGYFISLSNKNTIQLLRRGILVFLLGLLLNIGLNFNLLLKIKFSGWQYDPFEYIFGVDILFLAGLSIVILGMLNRTGKLTGYLIPILIAGITFLTPIMNSWIEDLNNKNYVLPFVAGNASWSYFPLFPWLAYPLAGFWFQRNEYAIRNFFGKNRTLSISGIIVIITGTLLFSGFGFKSSVHLQAYYHHGIPMFLWITGLIILWTSLLGWLLQKFPDSKFLIVIRWTGKNVTLIYVIQWLIIGNLATEIYRTQSIGIFGGWLAGITFITLCMAYGLLLIRKIFTHPKTIQAGN